MSEEPILDGDYKHAVVQVICLLHEGRYNLVFASAELLPAELPAPPNEELISEKAARLGGNGRIFFRRYVTTAAEALAWYEMCRSGRFTMLLDDAKHPTTNEPLFEEPSWPQLITGGKFPVSGDVASSVRAHHLYPTAVPTLLERLFKLHPELQKWCSDRIFASFLRYPELAGSVHLLAPNQVYRSLSVRLHIAEDKSESTAIEITPRAGMPVDGLEAIVIEHRPTGISSYQVQPFGANPYMLVKHHGMVEEVEILIRCPARGLLERQEPSGFVRRINMEMSLTSARKKVTVPGSGGAATDEYEVPISETASSSTLGDTEVPSEIPALLRTRERERIRDEEAKRLGQKWFHSSKAEATEFVRSLIQTARERVWIVDPYFATAELFSFALATSRRSVEVVILTGASTILTKDDIVDTTMETGDMLFQCLQAQAENSNIKVLVMTGELPTVHDRFLVIDNAVWFTGNSLNQIGERAGMMISVPAPLEVIAKLEGIMQDNLRTKPLDVWVAARKANREA
jgi:hypothetical protein